MCFLLRFLWPFRRHRLSDRAILLSLLFNTENTMALADDLNTKVDALSSTIDNIRQDIADIKASIPVAGGLTEAEAQALGAKLDAVVQKASDLDAENPSA